MMEGEEVLEEDMGQGIEGLDMIILVDMSVRWELDPVILMKGLMVDIWADQVAIKIGIQVAVVLLMLSMQGEPKGKE